MRHLAEKSNNALDAEKEKSVGTKLKGFYLFKALKAGRCNVCLRLLLRGCPIHGGSSGKSPLGASRASCL